MRGFCCLLLSLILACAAPAFAQTAEERARLDWVQQRGRSLYEIDRAAWVTTDDLRRRMPDLAAAGIRGWTVEREGAGYNVIYYTGEGDARLAAYRARVEDNRVVAAELIGADSRPPLTPLQRRLADARGAVGRVPMRACTRSGLNLAVIPPETPDAPIDLYILTPQTENGVFPFGGHNRMTISASGEVQSHRAFTNSCMNLSNQPQNEGQPAGLFVTHLLDQIPTEIHVFMSIWTGVPVYVGTSDPQRVWAVEGDRIRLVTNPPRVPGT